MRSWKRNMNRDEILIIHGTEYVSMTKELLAAADLAGMIGGRNTRIGIKPNLVSPTPASLGATTHPEVVEGLLLYLREQGFSDVTIMEGSWVGARTEEAFDECGYRALAEKYGVRLLDTQKERARSVDCAGMTLNICECAFDVDFMINVPVLKGHCQTRVTCALKNMKGLLPNREKRRFHAEGLHRPIAHLSRGVRQDFILVDNICGDPGSEDGGNPTVMNRLFAAADPVLCDAFACSLMGVPVKDVPYIGMAASLGAGCADPERAKVTELNAPVCAVKLPDRNRMVRLQEAAEEVESCSACYNYLMMALDMLEQEGLLQKLPHKVHIGQGCRGRSGELGVGTCTKGYAHSLPGCPPTERQMYEFLKSYILEEADR